MTPLHLRGLRGASSVLAAAVVLFLPSCTTSSTVTTVPASHQALIAQDDDFSELLASVKNDLHRHSARESARLTYLKPQSQTAADLKNDRAFGRSRRLFVPLSGQSLAIPVVGISPAALDDNWHAPRDGGSRLHKGIDIFAKRGTPVVAVTDGIVSFIGDQPKGGHCVWLSTDEGVSFYYAHLDRWAPGLYEGMEVRRGEVLGYVGDTGNARGTFPHLHFGINQFDEMVNPYPVLVKATPISRAQARLSSGNGATSSVGSR